VALSKRYPTRHIWKEVSGNWHSASGSRQEVSDKTYLARGVWHLTFSKWLSARSIRQDISNKRCLAIGIQQVALGKRYLTRHIQQEVCGNWHSASSSGKGVSDKTYPARGVWKVVFTMKLTTEVLKRKFFIAEILLLKDLLF
jgi:hypothetical protein